MPNPLLTSLEGVAGTEATASKRGYYYQDVVTALAWTRLVEGQTLLVEVAEDYAVATHDHAEISQVRDVAASLTLARAIPFLENAIVMIEGNADRRLSFVYRTTSSIAPERAIADRPAETPGLIYWEKVKSGADSAPLIAILKRLATPGGRLAAYLDKTSIDRVHAELIAAVTWATNEPSSTRLQLELAERIATVAHHELDYPWTDGKHLMAVIIDTVTKTSILPDAEDRKLTHSRLREVMATATHKSIPFPEYQQLVRDAALAKNPPVDQVNSDIERRLFVLRRCRVFPESATQDAARLLANDVRHGGRCEVGDKTLRALALSWCARVLAETEEVFARTLITEAKALAPQSHVSLVAALLTSRHDVEAARQSIAAEAGDMAQTIRYAIARRSSLADGWAWVKASRLGATNFDPDGMFLVLWDLLQQQQWMEALAWQESIPEVAYGAYPALLWGAAHALVANSIPEPMQHLALEGPPVGRELPLSDQPKALMGRRLASGMFRRFRAAAIELGLANTGELAIEYSLWLQLKDRLTHATAAAEILQLWNSSEHDSRWVPLVLTARLPINEVAVAEAIDRRAATYGALNFNDARARLALVLAMPATEWIDQWPDIRGHIQPYFNEAFLEHCEIEGLQQVGRRDAAQAALDQATHLPPHTRERLLIEMDALGDDVVLANLRAAVGEQGTPHTMHNLVAALVKAKKFSEAIDVASTLVQQTQDHEDAERLLHLLKKENRWIEIESFLDANPDQVEQSNRLAAIYLEVLFRHGRWDDARRLSQQRPDLGARRNQVELQLAILSGNWDELGLLLEQAQADPELSVDDQRQFAHLATALGRGAVAKRFTKSAAERCPDDPAVLWDCYLLAVRGRWEDDPAVRSWMQHAIGLSSSDGPVQAKSLDELVEMAPAWRKRTEIMGQGLVAAEMYLALVAQQLNRPLASVMLGTAEANRTERDLRRRSPIGAFAGIARPAMTPSPRIISLDQTALLTLGHLRLLPRLLANFDRIWVPHSVGAWLFAEHQEIQFHQPSRVFDARRVLNALARQELRVARADAEFSKELAQRIGSDLAQLIRAAQVERQAEGNAFVVRTAPIHVVNSMLRDAADVDEYSDILRSSLELVRSLHHHGAITEEQFDRATAFLSQHDQGWAGDAPIPSGATLYLDDVTVAYFHHLDLWHPALDAGFRLFIHKDVQKEAAALDQLDSASQDIDGVIDDLRRFLAEGQRKNIVSFLRQPSLPTDTDEEREDARFLLMQSIEQQEGVEAVVVDDRAANKFPFFSHADGTTVGLRTTLDVLDWLRERDALDEKEWFGFRNDLRRSGYLFVPVEARELVTALNGSAARDGVLSESASARAIRENLLLAQASGMLQLPAESDWLMNSGLQVNDALTTIWKQSDDDAETIAKASWLVEYSRWDGLTGRMVGLWTEERLVELDALAVGRLLFNSAIPKARRAVYNDWLQSTYLDELQYAQPRVFEALCARSHRQLADLTGFVARSEFGLSKEEVAVAAAEFSKSFINDLPLAVRERMFDDDTLLEKLGLSRSTRISVHMPGEPSFDTKEMYEQAGRLYGGEARAGITDKVGEEWALEVRGGTAVYCRHLASNREFAVQHAQLVSGDSEVRVAYLEQLAHDQGLRSDQITAWIEEARLAPLHPHRFSVLDRDMEDSPRSTAVRLRDAFSSGGVTVRHLVPLSVRYYDRLVTPWQGEDSLTAFAANLTQRPPGANPLVQAKQELLWSAHSALVPKLAISEMDVSALRAFSEELRPTLDLWSLTGLLEAILGRSDAHSELLDLIEELIRTFAAALKEEAGRLEMTVALGGLVDACLNTSGLFTGMPVFWRRHASLAHAALIERSVLELGVPAQDLSAWAHSSAPQFQTATLADLSMEPRWNGFMFSPPQLKQELIGRVLAGLQIKRGDFNGRFDGLVFGDNPESLESQRIVYFSALPGPLEGGSEIAQELPAFLLDELSTTLRDESVPLSHRLLAAAHIAGLGNIPDSACAAMSDAVRALHQADVTDGERERWSSLLMRLSLAASSSRNPDFGAAVTQFIHGRPGIPLGLRVYAGVTACGAHEEIFSWAKEVANFLEHCASLELSKDQAEYLLDAARILGEARPLLRPAVAQTLARLQGVAQRIG